MNYKIDVQDLIPENIRGSENNAVTFIDFQSETDAFDLFKKLSENLLNINKWNINKSWKKSD
jgi:hypothetical protein